MAGERVLTAGSAKSNDISIEHPTVSARHIELRVNNDGSFDVIEQGDTAGTFVFHNGEWTRFGHATVAGDERLRLGTYETTAGDLVEMAGEGEGGEPGGPVDGGSDPRSEDVHEVTTRRRGRRRRSTAEEDAGEQRRMTGRKRDSASKKEPRTEELPARHTASEAATGSPPRTARTKARPETEELPARRAAEAAPVTDSPPGAPKSLAVAYLLWLFLGGFGAHRFYLGSIGIGITHAALLVVGVVSVVVFGGEPYNKALPTMIVLLGVAVLTGLVVWVIVDGFLIPGLVQDRRGKSGEQD